MMRQEVQTQSMIVVFGSNFIVNIIFKASIEYLSVTIDTANQALDSFSHIAFTAVFASYMVNN